MSGRSDDVRHGSDRYSTFLSLSGDGVARFELRPPLPVNAPEEEQVRHILEYARVCECNELFAGFYGRVSRQMVGLAMGDFVPSDQPARLHGIFEFIRARYRLVYVEEEHALGGGHPAGSAPARSARPSRACSTTSGSAFARSPSASAPSWTGSAGAGSSRRSLSPPPACCSPARGGGRPTSWWRGSARRPRRRGSGSPSNRVIPRTAGPASCSDSPGAPPEWTRASTTRGSRAALICAKRASSTSRRSCAPAVRS